MLFYLYTKVLYVYIVGCVSMRRPLATDGSKMLPGKSMGEVKLGIFFS